MANPQRGGLRNPPGGRPPKPETEKAVKFQISLPPDVFRWLDEQTAPRSRIIAEMVRERMTK